MARVTVEDCIQVVPNRFDLVISAAQRAKQISSGMPLTIDRDNDKDAVVSLREIADKTIDVKLVQEEIVSNFQRKTGFDPSDQIEDEQHPTGFTLDARQEIAGLIDQSAGFSADAEPAAGGMSFIEENIEVED